MAMAGESEVESVDGSYQVLQLSILIFRRGRSSNQASTKHRAPIAASQPESSPERSWPSAPAAAAVSPSVLTASSAAHAVAAVQRKTNLRHPRRPTTPPSAHFAPGHLLQPSALGKANVAFGVWSTNDLSCWFVAIFRNEICSPCIFCVWKRCSPSFSSFRRKNHFLYDHFSSDS